MGKLQRIKRILQGLIIMFCATALLIDPKENYGAVVVILEIMLFFYGVKSLLFYFSLARHMVGGQMALIRGILLLDLGLFTWSIADVPRFFVILYLVCIHGAAGIIDILGALEERRLGNSEWKMKLAQGLAGLLVAGACIVSMRSVQTLVIIFSAGLFYSAFVRIGSAFRRTAVVYIQ